jgi:hypothetical protein
MKLSTTSETISFAKELEKKCGDYYEAMSKKYDQAADFTRFKDENVKFALQIQRAYQSVITDAIEGCFAFNLESDNYALDTDLADEMSFSDALAKAIQMEETVVAFYDTAAEQSMSLMADIPRNFKIVNRKRGKRLDQLKSM